MFHQPHNLITLHQRKLLKLKNVKKAMLEKMFPQNGSNVPEIRFAGFTDAWEQRKLSDVAEIKTGFAFKSDEFNDSGELLVVTNGNIQDNEPDVNNAIGNRISIFDNKLRESFILDIGDILVTMDGTVGRTAKVNNKCMILAQRVGRVVAKEDKEFLYHWLSNGMFSKDMLGLAHGGTIKHISLNEIGSYSNFFPVEVTEQNKIGVCFTNLDNLITLHQRKLDLLKVTKKSMLQKMFPKDGESVPEIRFAGFTDAWEQRKLGDIAGFNPKAELPEVFEYVDLESVVGTEMISHREKTKITAPSRAQRLAQVGDLFYQTVRPYQRNNYLFEKTDNIYVFSTGYAQMRPNIDGYFLLSFVQTDILVKAVLDSCTGTSYPAINANDLAEMEVRIPPLRHEQEQIGAYFRNLDNLITLHQRELDLLKDLKKSMLQQMFI